MWDALVIVFNALFGRAAEWFESDAYDRHVQFVEQSILKHVDGLLRAALQFIEFQHWLDIARLVGRCKRCGKVFQLFVMGELLLAPKKCQTDG